MRHDPGRQGADVARLAALARDVGEGEPLTFLDLDAVDHNLAVVLDFARRNELAVRPAVKALGSPELCRYVLDRIPEPRVLVFHVRTARELAHTLPAETDYMMGHPASPGEMRAFLSEPGWATFPPIRILAESLAELRAIAKIARDSRRQRPVEVALKLASGYGSGGLRDAGEISTAAGILRAEQEHVRLTAVMCYEGRAVIEVDDELRRHGAARARRRYREHLTTLRRFAADLIDDDRIIRNGPGSSNFVHWAGTREANEMSPGSALLYPRYLDGRTHRDLVPALIHAAPVVATDATHDGDDEVLLKGGAWPTAAGAHPRTIHPESARDLSPPARGNNASIVRAPRWTVTPGDYVLMRPYHAHDAMEYFGGLHVVRSQDVTDVWATFARWGTPAGHVDER